MKPVDRRDRLERRRGAFAASPNRMSPGGASSRANRSIPASLLTGLAGLAFVTLLLTGFAAPASAMLIETSIKVPVAVADRFGKRVSREVVVELMHDEASPAPRPLLLLLHGRATDAKGRAAVNDARYSDNARWFAALGFLVAIPIRIGYGETGGDDVEDTGACNRQDYEPAAQAIARQAEAVLERLRLGADVANDRAVVVGLSFGSIGAMAMAARKPRGVQAVINFAGGGGGNGEERPGDPCDAETLRRIFGRYGETARIPTLWVYAQNDRFFGTRRPREWFDAFVGSGGIGEFALLPAHGDDGHVVFRTAPETWRGRVVDFLRSNGFATAGDYRPR